MPIRVQDVAARFAEWRRRNLVAEINPRPFFGPLLIDRGGGLLYDVERNITWLQDTNYAKTIGRSADGQMNWHAAKSWVAGLDYRGITGWRLPDARGLDGSGPREGENCDDGEIGHLFMIAAKRMSPPDLTLLNFEPFSIYWYGNAATMDEAFAFKMIGMRQGRLAKDPWSGDMPIPLTDKVLVWPVHDGDIAPRAFARLRAFIRAVLFRAN